jgi:hypothetical protein
MKQDISGWYIIRVMKDGAVYGYYKGFSTSYHPTNLDNADRAKIYRTKAGAERSIAKFTQVIYGGPEFTVEAVPFRQFVNDTQMELCGWGGRSN